jgi:hypothetical protein
VPIAAIALYAGARLSKQWAFFVPLAILALSDLYLDHGSTKAFSSMTRLTGYGTFAAIVLLGRLPKADAGLLVRGGLSVAGSTIFFLTSNFAVWASGCCGDYDYTVAGLETCYAAAIPFYRNALAADLIGTAALFGVEPILARIAARRQAEHTE